LTLLKASFAELQQPAKKLYNFCQSNWPAANSLLISRITCRLQAKALNLTASVLQLVDRFNAVTALTD